MIKYVAAFVQPLSIIQPSYLIHIVNCKSLSFNVFQNKSCYALSPTLYIPTVFHSSRKVQWLGKSQVLSRAIRFESTEIGFCLGPNPLSHNQRKRNNSKNRADVWYEEKNTNHVQMLINSYKYDKTYDKSSIRLVIHRLLDPI